MAELYMVFTVLGPNTAGVEPPTLAMILRLLTASIFFGLFGALAGMGIGLLVTALVNTLRR